jgi:hypothetical protein
VYVRHINFNGVTKINDEVLRREMRQLEGGWLSNALVERSKQRMQRLPYIEKVESETKPVPGSPDLVDVEFEIKEGPPAQLGGGVGYSESQSFILNGNYADSNFMGSGERISVDLNSGRFSKVYGVSHTNPYTSIDGVARTLSLTYRDVTQFVSASSDFSSETLAFGVDYGYPISEFQALRVGLSAQRASLLTGEGSATRRATGSATTATTGRNSFPSRTSATASSSRRPRSRPRASTRSSWWWAGTTIPATVRCSRPGHAALAVARLHVAGQRRRILHGQLRVPAVRADLWALDPVAVCRARLRRWTSVTRRRCRHSATSSRAAPTRFAAIGSPGSGRRTASATPTAAT